MDVGADELRRALILDLPDFEDAVQAACAHKAGTDTLVTRDAKGYRDLGMPVLSPGAAL